MLPISRNCLGACFSSEAQTRGTGQKLSFFWIWTQAFFSQMQPTFSLWQPELGL